MFQGQQQQVFPWYQSHFLSEPLVQNFVVQKRVRQIITTQDKNSRSVYLAFTISRVRQHFLLIGTFIRIVSIHLILNPI